MPSKYYYLLPLLLFLLPLPGRAQDARQRQKDSLHQALTLSQGKEIQTTYQRLISLYYPEIRNAQILDTVLALYDEYDAEAERQADATVRSVIRYNILGALFSARQDDEALRRAPELLEFMASQGAWRYYYMARKTIVDMYRRTQGSETALQEAQAIYDHAHKRGDAGGMGMAFYAMSRIYSDQRMQAQSEESLKECISLLRDSTLYLNVLADAYVDLAINYIAQKRHDDVLRTAAALEKDVIPRYELASKSRQSTAWRSLYTIYTDVYLQSGKFDEAEIYLHKQDSISNGSLPHYREWSLIYMGRKQYVKALEMANKFSETSLTEGSKNFARSHKMEILARMGDVDGSMMMFSEIIASVDSIHNAQVNAKLDEIRTSYEVDRHIAEKQRNLNYFLLALSGCLLLAGILAIWIYYARTVTRKNRGLYRQIKEQDSLKEALAQMTQLYESLLPPLPMSIEDEAETGKELPSDKQQRKLIARFHDYLLRDKNFAQADMNLDRVILELATNRSYLFEAVKAVTQKTPVEYIRILQLEESKRMLETHPDHTVEAIATDCGFNSRKTFYRLFKERYNISPAEYRNMMSEKS